MKHRKLFALMGLFACLLGLVACGDDNESASAGGDGKPKSAITRNPANAKTTIRVGSKNFTEQIVLGEIYAQGLEAAGYKVERQLNLGNENVAQQALADQRIDGYPEYIGTALLSICNVPAESAPKDPAIAYKDVRECFASRGLTALEPTPFTSSNEVAVSADTADRHQLIRISDLKKVDQEFTLYGAEECRERSDCLAGLQDVYGLKFKTFAETPVSERHEVLKRGANIASIVFTTDPQNRRDGIVLLEDDLGMFPPNTSTFVVRNDIAEQAGPDLKRVIARLQRGLTDEVMQELNARVDLDKQSPAQVAADYLEQARLVVK
jgi:osmoprotectant transport system substrate-binding protein